MNFASILGLIAAIAVTTYAIIDSAKSPKIFADVHGIVIVWGGTITVALLSFPFKRIFAAISIILRKMFFGRKINYAETIRQIVEISEIYRVDPKRALASLPANCHPFLKDGVKLLVEYGFSLEELDQILSTAVKGKKKRDEEEIKVWHTLSRFPPAFGLLGATLGMISLLQTLGEPNATDRIGPAMATALVATFYGLLTANLVLIPIAENLSEVSAGDQVLRNIIREGLLLIHEKRHPIFIEECLKAFLPPSYRAQEFSGKGDSGKIGGSRAAA